MFRYERYSETSGGIFFGDEAIASMRDLLLINARFQRAGECLISEHYGLPMYWQQYERHEDPERNTGSHGNIVCLKDGAIITLKIMGESLSREAGSVSMLTISHARDAFRYHVESTFRVSERQSWLVTPNASHGELEFCNLWIADSFTTDARRRKKYSACYQRKGKEVLRIPHHHVESSDKHNIAMRGGDSFLWLLEDENPCFELLSQSEVSAGVCAYMWDAHFAYKICERESVRLPEGFMKSAEYLLSSIGRKEGEVIVSTAKKLYPEELHTTPIYTTGVNTFSETLLSYSGKKEDVWSWSTEVVEGSDASVKFTLDHEQGFSDCHSLRIGNAASGTARWLATALGPAFGQPAFRDGVRFKLRGYVKTEDCSGAALLKIRLHREGEGSVFDLANYEVYTSERCVQGTSDWRYIEVLTAPIIPSPDRLHLILELQGSGACWFDDVLLTEEDENA